MQKKRVLYLDLIRIVCFLMVTSFHFAIGVRNFGISANVNFYQEIIHIGWGAIATSCFFMVSGAALIYRYRETFSLKEFYKKRFFGLYPLFWLAYLFMFLEFFYHYKSMPEVPKINFLLSVIGMDGYFNDWVPTFYMIGEWFLGALIMLYLLFPIFRITMCKCKYILPAVLFVASIVLIYYNPFPIDIDKNPIVCSMYFVLGMLIEMLRESQHPAFCRDVYNEQPRLSLSVQSLSRKIYSACGALHDLDGGCGVGEIRADKKPDCHNRKTFVCLFFNTSCVFRQIYTAFFGNCDERFQYPADVFQQRDIYLFAGNFTR